MISIGIPVIDPIVFLCFHVIFSGQMGADEGVRRGGGRRAGRGGGGQELIHQVRLRLNY